MALKEILPLGLGDALCGWNNVQIDNVLREVLRGVEG
jgi:hypothetical protein